MPHEGHRQRIYEKLQSGGLLHEHELLEILLFNAYPRKNTNPIAHELLTVFGSVKGVFEASVKELCAVPGVGESVANYITCVAKCAALAYSRGSEDIYLKNYGDFKEFTAKRLRKMTEEVVELYLLEKNGRVKYIFSRTNMDKHRVLLEREEIAAVVASVKPFGLLIAHNHLTGSSKPSERDDDFTGEVQMLCSLNGVTLYDHCIYAADNDVYSYFSSGRIDEIKSKFSVTAIIKGQ